MTFGLDIWQLVDLDSSTVTEEVVLQWLVQPWIRAFYRVSEWVIEKRSVSHSTNNRSCLLTNLYRQLIALEITNKPTVSARNAWEKCDPDANNWLVKQAYSSNHNVEERILKIGGDVTIELWLCWEGNVPVTVFSNSCYEPFLAIIINIHVYVCALYTCKDAIVSWWIGPWSAGQDFSAVWHTNRRNLAGKKTVMRVSAICNKNIILRLNLCSPLPEIDIIEAVMIIWRVRGKIISSVLYSIVCNNWAQCNAHTWTDLTVVCWLGLAYLWLYCVLHFICVRLSFWGLFFVMHCESIKNKNKPL